MTKEFTRMQELAGVITEGLYTTQMDIELPVTTEGNRPVYVPGSNPDITDQSAQDALDIMTKENTSGKMTKEEFKSKIREMILAEKSLNEAKKDKEEEEAPAEEVDVNVDTPTEPTDAPEMDMAADTTVDLNSDGTPDVDAGSSEAKKAFGDLTDAFQAAKALGDDKLIRQIANTITYFNKNIILKQG